VRREFHGVCLPLGDLPGTLPEGYDNPHRAALSPGPGRAPSPTRWRSNPSRAVWMALFAHRSSRVAASNSALVALYPGRPTASAGSSKKRQLE
jgi:hypothetical protein